MPSAENSSLSRTSESVLSKADLLKLVTPPHQCPKQGWASRGWFRADRLEATAVSKKQHERRLERSICNYHSIPSASTEDRKPRLLSRDKLQDSTFYPSLESLSNTRLQACLSKTHTGKGCWEWRLPACPLRLTLVFQQRIPGSQALALKFNP